LPIEVLETILRYNKKLEEDNALLKTEKQPLKEKVDKSK
jgi:hypothetical protein